jgi:hypothetical protein
LHAVAAHIGDHKCIKIFRRKPGREEIVCKTYTYVVNNFILDLEEIGSAFNWARVGFSSGIL